jgi:cold shock protein
MRLATRWPTSCAVYVIEAVGPCTFTNRPLIFLLNGLNENRRCSVSAGCRSSATVFTRAGGRAAAIRFVQTRRQAMMPTGTVKWFNPTKGYGFIQPQDGGRDVFVHIFAVERAGLSSLNEGQTVHYEVVSNRGKESADNLKAR